MKVLIAFLVSILSISLLAEINKETVVYGTVDEYLGKGLYLIKDDMGQTFKIHKSKLVSEKKLNLGVKTSFVYKFQIEKFPGLKLNKKILNSLNEEDWKKLREAYVDFFVRAEKDHQYVTPEAESTYNKIINKFIGKAYATGGQKCVFGGWMSEKKGRYCSVPWKATDKQYTSEFYCGSSTLFRCNPLLFGYPNTEQYSKSEINGVKADFSKPQRRNQNGYCISVENGYGNVSSDCAKISEDRLDDIIVYASENVDKFLELSNSISDYCKTQSNYSTCQTLENRVAQIKSNLFDADSGEKICQILENKDLEPSFFNSCPASIYVKCIGAMGESFGYLDNEYANIIMAQKGIKGFRVKGKKLGIRTTPIGEGNGEFSLRRAPCSSEKAVMGEKCTNLTNASSQVVLNLKSSTQRKGNKCQNNVCAYNGKCAVTDSGTTRMINVNMLCPCMDIENDGKINVASLCKNFPMQPEVPSNFNQFSTSQKEEFLDSGQNVVR